MTKPVYPGDKTEIEIMMGRKQIDAALELNDSMYRSLFENAPVGIVIADNESYYLDANTSACSMLGYTHDELVGLHTSNVATQLGLANTESIPDDLATKRLISREWQFRRKDGSVFTAEVMATMMPDGKLMGVIHDISERKQAELYSSWLVAIVESSDDAIISRDLDGYVTSWNHGAERIYGYAAAEIVGTPINRLIPDDRLAEEEQIMARLRRGEKLERFETIRQTKDRRLIDVSITTSAITDTTGKIVGVSKIARDITERRKAFMIASRLAAIVESSDDAIIGKDLNGIITSWNHGAEKIFGYTAPEMVGKSITRLIPEDRRAEEEQILTRLRRGERLEHFETLRQAKDKRLIEVSITTSPIKDAGGKIIGASKIIRDIKILKDREREIVRQTHLYAALSQCNQAIVHCTNEKELLPIICRDAVEFGGMKMAWIGMYDEASKLIKHVASFGAGVELLDRIDISPQLDSATGRGPTAMAYRYGQPVWCEDFQHDPTTAVWHERAAKYGFKASASLPLSCGGVTVGVFNLYADAENAFDTAAQKLLLEMSMDISFALNRFYNEAERKKEQSQLFYLANFDSLTGLPNRTQMADHFKYALSLVKRSNEHLAVLFIDIDRFKNINDSLGHSIGDAFLIAVAKRIQLVLREEDTASRLGGDEFILILPGCDSRGAIQVAQKLLKIVSEPYQIAQYKLLVTASIGIALYPEDGADLETLSKRADTAMYRVKQEGRDGYRLFTSEMQAHVTRNMQLVDGMRQALDQNQFQLHYQPQISIRDGHIVGFEALLRWKHPELGDVPPAEFIPVAEDTGLILPIGEWVLRRAAHQLKQWMGRGYADLVMAVNLSAVQFRHPKLPDMVSGILNETQLPAEFLELELTEGAMMQDPHEAIAVMDNLYDRGVRMSLDDFGTGYSSLNYLKKFKLYKLKIDQSFVRDIGTNPEDMAIVAAIIGMSKNLGLQTIAEGVETLEQLAYLHKNGCDEAQGFHFSKPIAAKEMEKYLVVHHT